VADLAGSSEPGIQDRLSVVVPNGSLPPHPPLPGWLQAVALSLAPVRFLRACRRRYGGAVRLSPLFDSGFVMVFDRDLIEQVFRAPPDRLHSGELKMALAPLLGRSSVVVLDGEEHLRKRRLLLPAFHGELMRAYEAVMREATDRAIDSWPVGKPFALLPSMRSLTLEVIARAVFGVEPGPRQEQLKDRVRAMVDPAALAAPSPTRWRAVMLAMTGRFGSVDRYRLTRIRALADELIYDEIAQRRKAPNLQQRQDVLSQLLLARDDDGRGMSDEELRGELVTLLLAGHETTAISLGWAFELLLRHPAELNRLEAELARGEADYLNAVIKEVLRLRPVITGVSRVVGQAPFVLGDHVLPAGTELRSSISAVHRGDRYPNPDAFRPERFLAADSPDIYTWLPFGGGTRRCLGASFATFEMSVVIRRVLERTRLLPMGRRPERSVRNRMTSRNGLLAVPERGVRVIQAQAPRP
jgi:cytochrome P450 family 135